MQECSALLEFLLCNHAGFKIVPGSFCEDSVFLDLVLHFLMHGQFWLHHSTRSGSFCRGLELFCSSVEASFFGLVVMPRIVEGAVRAAVTLIISLVSSTVGWGCFFAAVNGVGLFLCSSSGVGLFCSTRSGVGLFCSGFSVVGTPTILCQAIRRSCQSYTLHILASTQPKIALVLQCNIFHTSLVPVL